MIRPATTDDLSDIVRMGIMFNEVARADGMIEADTHSLIAYAEGLILSDSACLYLAVIDDQIVGMAGAVVYPSHINVNVIIGHETAWWVEPEHRGLGAGPELKEAIERWAESKGARFMIMASQPSLDGEKVNRYLARDGYRPIDQNHIRELVRRH